MYAPHIHTHNDQQIVFKCMQDFRKLISEKEMIVAAANFKAQRVIFKAMIRAASLVS